MPLAELRLRRPDLPALGSLWQYLFQNKSIPWVPCPASLTQVLTVDLP